MVYIEVLTTRCILYSDIITIKIEKYKAKIELYIIINIYILQDLKNKKKL